MDGRTFRQGKVSRNQDIILLQTTACRTLGKGRLAGIPYEQGGGISMHAPNGSSIYIQYHPGSGHHGVMPYYKISSGKNGIVRYYINGERVQ